MWELEQLFRVLPLAMAAHCTVFPQQMENLILIVSHTCGEFANVSGSPWTPPAEYAKNIDSI